MTTVWVVFENDYSDDARQDIRKIFDSEEKAANYASKKNNETHSDRFTAEDFEVE